MNIVHIFSGGLDSTTLLYYLLNEGHKVKTISFFYGQKHNKELECSKNIAKKLNIENKLIDLSALKNVFGKSSLTSEIDVPEGHYNDINMKSTVVPNRNMIFLSIAISYAISSNFDAVSIGVHAGDHAIYPDCRPVFINRMKEVAKVSDYNEIDILTPFLNFKKCEIVKIGLELKVPYEMTWTCYRGEEKPCLKCGACTERLEAFKLNNVKDPLLLI
ncbi:MAG: 7-cyano-7-deazaguanine synthase QueC [Thermodesulfobium narugense]|nr:MAG: 7-cyano-7-deazaguanine synthase QueC [Thermodesulfobium narugense]